MASPLFSFSLSPVSPPISMCGWLSECDRSRFVGMRALLVIPEFCVGLFGGVCRSKKKTFFTLPGSSSTSFRSTTNLFSVTNGIDESVSSVHAKVRCSNQQCEPRVRVRERADGERLSEILCSSNHLFFSSHTSQLDFRTLLTSLVFRRRTIKGR